MKSVIFFLSLLILSQSCASMFSGTKERIRLQSDVTDTRFYYGNQFLGKNTGVLVIDKKHLKGARIVARKEGCQDTYVDVKTEFDETALLGILIDLGIVSVLIVDWSINGATREASKTLYTLNPSC